MSEPQHDGTDGSGALPPASGPSSLIHGATATLPARLASKMQARDDGCIAWTGATALKRDGVRRPTIQVGGRGSLVTHVARIVLVLSDGVPLIERLNKGLEAGHKCGHYWCVNPEHLIWQTRTENEASKRGFAKE